MNGKTAADPISISVVICNYNYKRFIADAIESALNQSCVPLEVIVVDDGSTDGSPEYVAARFGDRVKLLTGENRGQLSAFARGIRMARGDFVAFLDSDDNWKPDHLQTVADIIGARPHVDFLMVGCELFGNAEGLMDFGERERYYGLTAMAVLEKSWIGANTSCLAVRTDTLRQIVSAVPENLYPDWKVRADDVIVFGSSVFGSRKYRAPHVTVRYRVHGENAFYGVRHGQDYNDERIRKIAKLFAALVPHCKLPLNPVYSAIEAEVRSGAELSRRRRWKLAKRALRSRGPLSDRVRVFFLCLFRRFTPPGVEGHMRMPFSLFRTGVFVRRRRNESQPARLTPTK